MHIIGEGGPRDRRSIPLATKQGDLIPNVRRQECVPARMLECRRIGESRFHNIRTRSLSSTYNCVGLVFATRRTWVDPDEVARIFQGDGYKRVDIPEIGDIAVYRKGGNIKHVAVVTRIDATVATGERNILLLSQWGADGEYLHSVGDVPEVFGQEVEYWSERRRR